MKCYFLGKRGVSVHLVNVSIYSRVFLYHVFVFACISLLADLPFLDFQP